MADIARAALPIAGFFFFGPVGALVGGLLADVLFPLPGVKGPRLNELNVQHSTVGAPVPLVYGTAALAGNVIWSSGLIETKHEDEQGGFLGIGGQEVTTYSYSVDVAIGIAEGQISGIRRIWADADLIYDASDDATLAARFDLEDFLTTFVEVLAGIRAMSAQLQKEIYLGTEDQLPDPTIEADEGVGNTPAYRGLAYIVIKDFQLEKYGNRIPNFRFEVYTGTPTECGLYSPGNLEPWYFQLPGPYAANINDPRNPANSHVYSSSAGSPLQEQETLSNAVGVLSGAFSDRLFYISAALGPEYGDNIYIQGWAPSSSANWFLPCEEHYARDEYVTLYLQINSIQMTPAERYGCTVAGGPAHPFFANPCDYYEATGGMDTPMSYYNGSTSGFRARITTGIPPEDVFNGVGVAQGADPNGDCSGDEPDNRWHIYDVSLAVSRTLLPPSPCTLGTPLAGAPGWCVFNGQISQDITWTPVSGTFKCLQEYDHTGEFGLVTQYPVGPCLRNDHPDYNNQAYWEAAYAAAVAAGEPLVVDPVYGDVDGYPSIINTAYFSECETVDAVCVPMAVIVADICRRAGLRTDTATQIDVSGLTTCVSGYIIGRQMSARDALGPLRAYGLWDAVESQAILTFVERGAALVDTLSADDLGAHEAGSQPPSAVEVSRVQEKDLPRRLRLHFANFLHDHEPSEQAASRLSTEAVNELDVELPISMEPDTAAQLAEIMLYEAYVSRNTYRLALDNTWLALEPTDCIEIPVDGQTQRVRIVSVDYSIGGIARIEAVADDDGTYTSTAIATPGTPSGGVPGSGGSALICPSGLVLLDIPRLATGHIDAGYYAAIYNTCGDDGWECAELYRSNDGGLTFGRVARTNGETTVGEIDAITGPATDPTLPGDSPAYDDTSSITVTLFEGTLASITDAQIAAGQNLAAIGRDGRWVIIQFKTATFDTGDQYTLTDLIWGVNGTEHLLGTTVDGDSFVLLSDSDLLRIPESADAIGVEKQFKIVTCGEAVDAVAPVDFTTWGLSYLRPCPSTVISCSTTEPPEDAAHDDAYYLPNDTSLGGVWADHGGEIATWSDETDSWVYCTPAAGTIVHCSDEDEDVIPPGGGGDPTPAPWQRVIDWQDEGVSVADTGTTVDTVNFVGPGVTATLDSSGVLEVYIPGGGDTSDTSDTSGPGGGGFPNATYLTEQDETADLPNSLRLVEGSNITFDTDTSGNTLAINAPIGTDGNWLTVYQVADLVITNGTTGSTYVDTDLKIDGLVAGTYAFKCVYQNTSSTSPDQKIQIAFTGTATNVGFIGTSYNSSLSGTPTTTVIAGFAPLFSHLLSVYNVTTVDGTFTVTGTGNISIQTGQITPSANAVTFHKGSWMMIMKLD